MATCDAAKVLGMHDDLGTLAPGTAADITFLELHEGEFEFTDSYRQTRIGGQKLSAVGLVRKGNLATNSNRLKGVRN